MGATGSAIRTGQHGHAEDLDLRSEVKRLRRALAGSEARLKASHAQQIEFIRDVRAAHTEERNKHQELQQAYLSTIQLLAAAVEARDGYTGAHLDRVRGWSLAIGRHLGWQPEECGVS